MRQLRIPFLIALSLTLSLILYAGRYDTAAATKTFLDRNGRVIGTIAPASQGIQYWTSLDSIPRELVEKTIRTEDRFFYRHRGVNPLSIAKAAVENLLRGQIVRGGSTITQQLAKNLIGASRPRTFWNKARETLLAVGLELKHSKSWILERYLNTIYYGRRSYGIVAAAQTYFGKGLAALTPEEIGQLVNLPKAPSRPALAARVHKPQPLARHFLEFAVSRIPNTGPVIQTTLDLDLQTELETAAVRLLATRTPEDPKLTAAIVVIDVKAGDLLAMVGSRDYFEEAIDGQVNAAVAPRQPGSTLKPFTYFAAFAKGFGPNSIVPDEPASFRAPGLEETESYAPQNFDRRYHGRMTIREALANSYNVPAVVTLNEIGLSFFHELLRRFGFTTFRRPPPHYGLAVTLGSGEVTLLELTNAYAALARGGAYLPYQFAHSSVGGVARGKVSDGLALASRQNLSEVTGPRQPVVTNAHQYAAQVTSILSDENARLKAFGFNESMTIEGHDVAVKTGTSYQHRDNWTVGYTPSYAVGVWVGHADGSPMTNPDGTLPTTGASGAAPLWHAAMENLLRGKAAERFTLARAIIPTPSRHVASISAPRSNWGILNPVDNSTFRISEILPREHQKIRARVDVRASSDTPPELTWYLDGRHLASTNASKPEVWLTPEPGRHRLRVESLTGENQEITFKVVDQENL